MGIVKPDLHNSVKTRVLLYKSQLKHSTSGSAPYSGKQTKPRNIENQESGVALAGWPVALASWPVGRLPWPVGRLHWPVGQCLSGFSCFSLLVNL